MRDTTVLLTLSLFSLSIPCLAVTRPLPVPSRIEAEDYDPGGPGISYYDSDAGNNGNAYRTDNVDIEQTQDLGGGYDVGWIAAGEWLNYTINVQETAVYRLDFRVAARDSAGAIQLSLDSLPLCAVAVPRTGAWQTWQTVSISNIVMKAGVHLLHLDLQTGGYNLNWIQISRQRSLTGGFLRASGKQIVNGSGDNVLLRGIGLGNWMLQEPYMMDVSGIATTQQELKNKITDLVGSNNMALFYDAWLSNYVRDVDIRKMADAGFNSIRLPMHFSLFTLPIDQEPVSGQNTWLESGFTRLENLLNWCETNHIYLILDMHACPGGQGYDRSISDYNPPAPSLWESAANRGKLIALWQELARRYANREWIGGYDLINEPNWTFENSSSNGCSDQYNTPLRQLFIDLTTAIRQVDTNHIIFLMGNCWGGNYNGLLPPWDSNLVIGFHKYWDSPTLASLQVWTDRRDQWNMPLWMGESGENSNEWFRDTVHAAEQLNISWSWWPWKKLNSVAGTVSVTEPATYQRILSYWRNGESRPSTTEAFTGLMDLAQATRLENCIIHPDVFDALMRPYPHGQTIPWTNHPLPGVIFAPQYDLGRQGEACFDASTDTSPYNSGYSYRNDSVDIEACSDASPNMGYDVGWLEAGDWMKYTTSPSSLAGYQVLARVAAANAGGSFYIDVGGSNVTGTISVASTGGWQNWRTISAGIIPGPRLLQSFKFVVISGGFNINWLDLRVVPGTEAGFPSLTINRLGSSVLLTWPSVASDYSLSSSSGLDPSSLWSPVMSDVIATNGLFTITLPIDSSSRFFRLTPKPF